MTPKKIVVRGARQHNLRNVDLEIPRDQFVVVTGLSGSGKSSLAFDTLYAEGQRRYVESLSPYARQFLEQTQKPDVDSIEGLPPTISIEQRSGAPTPRSTVATATELFDLFRVLYARLGQPHCTQCGKKIQQQTAHEIIEALLELPLETRLVILAPIVQDRKGEHRDTLEAIRREGYLRARIDGELVEVRAVDVLNRNKRHRIEVVVDRLLLREGIRSRLSGSVETALALGNGLLIAAWQAPPQAVSQGSAFVPPFASKGRGFAKSLSPKPGWAGASPSNAHQTQRDLEGEASFASLRTSSAEPRTNSRERVLGIGSQAPADLRADSANGSWQERFFSERFACADCRLSLPELSPRMFSFNSPYGACPKCDGLGTEMVVDEDLVVPDPELSLDEGAIDPWARAGRPMAAQLQKLLRQVAQECGVSHRVPFSKLPREARRIVLEGTTTEDEKRELSPFEGVLPNLERRFKETRSEYVRRRIQQYMNERICSACRGARLRPEALAVRVAGKTISEVVKFTIAEALAFFRDLALEGSQREVAERLLGEISNRLGFLANVGLSYLTLDRRSETLSGGEAQRIRLASQLGAGLVGVCYVLDEPTIGLHPRDNRMLLEALYRLRDMGNSLVVVEHDEETIRRADYLIDMGPGAGSSGGRLVAHGRPDEISLYPESITAKYLSGELEIPLPASRRKPANGWAIEVQGARQNNLKNVTVRFPLGLLCCVTGVSGSGKSTLVDDILYRAVHRKLNRSKDRPGEYDRILGIENIDRVAVIDQSPLGKTPRSNPCTYTGIFDEIRRLYSKVKESRVRGYTPARFSFNVKGGRCEACEGQGTKVIEMHFLPDVHVTCTQCRGTRYNQETLEVRYKGKNIAEVIKMSVEEAILFFQAFPRIVRMLTTLEDVGLGYISLGQPSTTLSGGEAQRVKLAAELGRGGDPSTSLRAAGHCLYIMDEPTTGLHFADIEKLLKVLGHLVDAGNSVILIEHNVHVIKCADYVIDLGPEGGDEGGGLVACGTPEEIAACADSHTGSVLASYLGRRAERSRSQALVSS